MRKALFVVALTLLFSGVFAQDDFLSTPKFSVGAQIGFPTLAGLNIEVSLTKLLPHYTAYLDAAILPVNIAQTNTVAQSYQLGMNYYFKQRHRGFYFGADAGSLLFSTSRIEENEVDYNGRFTAINGKLGFITKSRFYFRIEAGYSLFLFNLYEANDF